MGKPGCKPVYDWFLPLGSWVHMMKEWEPVLPEVPCAGENLILFEDDAEEEFPGGKKSSALERRGVVIVYPGTPLSQMVWEALCSHSWLVPTATVRACSIISILQKHVLERGCRRVSSQTKAMQLPQGHRPWILAFSLVTGAKWWWTWIQHFDEFTHGPYFQDSEESSELV